MILYLLLKIKQEIYVRIIFIQYQHTKLHIAIAKSVNKDSSIYI